MIIDFPFPDQQENMGGIISFEFIPAREVLRVLSNGNPLAVTVILAVGKSWRKGYSTIETSALSGTGSQTPSGYLKEKTFPGFFPKISPQHARLMEAMAREKFFLIKVKDANGFTRVLGTPENPAIFSFSESTGQSHSDRNGYTFSFAQQSENEALILEPDAVVNSAHAFTQQFTAQFQQEVRVPASAVSVNPVPPERIRRNPGEKYTAIPGSPITLPG